MGHEWLTCEKPPAFFHLTRSGYKVFSNSDFTCSEINNCLETAPFLHMFQVEAAEGRARFQFHLGIAEKENGTGAARSGKGLQGEGGKEL